MKAILLNIVVLSLFAVGVSTASAQLNAAQNSLDSVNRTEANQQRLNRIKNDETVQSQVDAVKAQQAIRREEQLQKRCTTAERILTQYQGGFQQNTQGYSTRFQTYHDKMAELVERLAENDEVDTTALSTHLATLQTMITNFAAQQPKFQAELGTIQSAACSDGETEYRAAMQEAQGIIRSMRTEAEQIRLFIQNTIRPELVSLRQQLVSSNGQ